MSVVVQDIFELLKAGVVPLAAIATLSLITALVDEAATRRDRSRSHRLLLRVLRTFGWALLWVVLWLDYTLTRRVTVLGFPGFERSGPEEATFLALGNYLAVYLFAILVAVATFAFAEFGDGKDPRESARRLRIRTSEMTDDRRARERRAAGRGMPGGDYGRRGRA